MEVNSSNINNILNNEIGYNSLDVPDLSSAKWWKFYSDKFEESITNTQKVYGFYLINVGSENNSNITGLNLIIRTSYGYDKAVRVKCEILDDMLNENRFTTFTELKTIYYKKDGFVFVECFLRLRETYSRFKIFPYLKHSTLNDNCYALRGNNLDLLSSTDLTTYVEGKQATLVEWIRKDITYGDLRVTGSLRCRTVDGDLNLSNGNVKTSKFVVGGNGITPLLDGVEKPSQNIMFDGNYKCGAGFYPKTHETNNLGTESNRWKEVNCVKVQSKFIDTYSPDGSKWRIKVDNEGNLSTQKV